jgi:hypothetical protein
VNTLKNQYGITMLGWLTIILMVGVLATGALKLAPAYFQYYSVASILDNMREDTSLHSASRREIEETLAKRLNISQVRLDKDAYSVKKVDDKRAYAVELDYEVRKSLFGNLDIVAKFQRSVEIGD